MTGGTKGKPPRRPPPCPPRPNAQPVEHKASIILCVTAHPDDEILIGATLVKLSSEGYCVYIGALADGELSRRGTDDQDIRRRVLHQREAVKVLGCEVLVGPRFPDQRLDSVDLLDLTRVIEDWIRQVHPEVVYTHSSGDLNADHRRVHDAVLPAVRPKSGVKAVYAFAGPSMLRFEPTSFWAVTEAQIACQLEALCYYGEELTGEWPAMEARLREYGHRVGVPYADGFEVVREIR